MDRVDARQSRPGSAQRRKWRRSRARTRERSGVPQRPLGSFGVPGETSGFVGVKRPLRRKAARVEPVRQKNHRSLPRIRPKDDPWGSHYRDRTCPGDPCASERTNRTGPAAHGPPGPDDSDSPHGWRQTAATDRRALSSRRGNSHRRARLVRCRSDANGGAVDRTDDGPLRGPCEPASPCRRGGMRFSSAATHGRCDDGPFGLPHRSGATAGTDRRLGGAARPRR